MKEAKFTKAPWKHFPNGCISDSDDNVIAEMFFTNTAPWKEDAALIAAAPDLYEAAMEFAAVVSDWVSDVGEWESYNELRAVLAKARGEENK